MLSVIGIAGIAGSGKNYLGDLICKEFGYVPWSFANPIKFRTFAMTDFSLPEIFGDVTRSEQVRSFLQEEGTERGRDVYGTDFWLDHAEAFLYYAKHYMNANGVVFTDVRFPNEAIWIKGQGGFVVRIFRDENQGIIGKGGTHRSEIYVNDLWVDLEIDNSGFASDSELLAQLNSAYLGALSG